MSTQTIKAIETRYKGYRFRSRLEARWAVFFDAAGIAWEFEKEGFDLGSAGLYLPDFWLSGAGIWVEIKPALPPDEEMGKIAALARAQDSRVLLLMGQPWYGEYWGIAVKRAVAEGNVGLHGRTISHLAVCRRCDSLGWIYENLDKGIYEAGVFGNCCDSERWPISFHLFNDAYQKARSARFEHGESG